MTGDRVGARRDSRRVLGATPSRACTEDARIARARTVLAVHRISTDTARCEVCQRPCPCDAANDAANALALGGLSLVTDGYRRPRGSGSPFAAVRGWLLRIRARILVELRRWPDD